MAAYGGGLALWRYSMIRQPELLLTEVTKVDIIFCCLALFGQPGLKLISERDDENIFAAPP